MKKIYLIILILPLVLTGCFQLNSQPPVTDGGIYRSRDMATNFEQITRIASVGATQNFSNDNSVFLKFDPTDPSTLYYSSTQSGLLVSYDSGGSWRSILKNKGTVNELEINPENPCELYAATKQNIFKSNDCGRKWDNVYIEKVANRSITDILLDHEMVNVLFMTLTDGSILMSEDSGISWQVWTRLGSNIAKKLYSNPKNSDILYITTGKNLLKSTDQGKNWESLNDIILKEYKFSGGNEVRDIYFIDEFEDAFYTISTYGVLKTLDGGITWEELPLLPQPKRETILSLAANPDNMNELYYSTKNAIYYSNDGGVNWKTIKSPTSRYNLLLLLHPADSNTIYLGTYAPPK